jgi:multidrug efflux pump
VFLFLRNVKATFIPIVTVPISLLGACLFLKMFGFSINILTLLAIVLAIGLVVDDAIVVLENIQRHIDEGKEPAKAALDGAQEIAPAIVAMTLTLTSVYAPLAFITGAVGQLFIEFAVALAGAVLISGFVALTLSPLMCAHTLKPHKTKFLSTLDMMMESMMLSYENRLKKILHFKKTCGILFLLAFGAIMFFVSVLPHETAPKEDRNLIGVYIPPIPGKDIEITDKQVALIEEKIGTILEVLNSLVFMGDWGGNVVLLLKQKDKRKISAQELVEKIRIPVQSIPSIDAFVWNENTGLPTEGDNFGNGRLSLVVSTTDDYTSLFNSVEKLRREFTSHKLFLGLNHDLKLDTPSYSISLDTNLMSSLNLTARQIAKTVEVFSVVTEVLPFRRMVFCTILHYKEILRHGI